MKAVHVKHWGGADAAVIENAALPCPGEGEVLVRVRATSINPVDWKIREGYLQEFISLPLLLGSDFAGEVEAIGEEVTGFEIGDAVYGLKGLRGGAYAEFTTVHPNEMAAKPKTLSFSEAATVPHAALTAWQALEAGELKAGQRILIHAAAGGVGHFAVQLAKQRGAYVIGTASDYNEEFLRELGVDEFVNYKAVPFETVVKDVDVVLDAVGFDTTTRSLEVLKPGGTLVCIVTPPPFEEVAKRQLHAKYVGGQPNPEILTQIAQLIDAGKLKPHISHLKKFSEIGEALQISQGQHVRGKIAVVISE